MATIFDGAEMKGLLTSLTDVHLDVNIHVYAHTHVCDNRKRK